MENKLYICVNENGSLNPLFSISADLLFNKDTLFSQTGGMKLNEIVASIDRDKMENVIDVLNCEEEKTPYESVTEECGGTTLKNEKDHIEELNSVIIENEVATYMGCN